jgi:hypothetical protein
MSSALSSSVGLSSIYASSTSEASTTSLGPATSAATTGATSSATGLFNYSVYMALASMVLGTVLTALLFI